MTDDKNSIWRPLQGPVVDWPLAMMDFQTLEPTDSHPCDLWGHKFEERGQTVAFAHGPNQQWYYLDKHRVDEVSILKIWDSWNNGIANSKCYNSLLGVSSNNMKCVRMQHLLTQTHLKKLHQGRALK